MKLKKLLVILLVISMISVLFVGCGNPEGNNENQNQNENLEQEDNNTNNNAENSSEESDEMNNSNETEENNNEVDGNKDEQEDEEVAEIIVRILSLGPMGDGYELVEEEINNITEEKINTRVKLQYNDIGSYAEQLNLAIASNEQVDVCLTTPIQSAGFTQMVSQNQLMPLNDLLDEYAPETKELVGELLESTTVKGNTYSITTYRALYSSSYLVMRKDILEDLNLVDQAYAIDSWSDYEAIIEEVTSNKDIAGIAGNDGDGTVITLQYAMHAADDFDKNYGIDCLGDTNKIIAVDESTDTVYNYFASDDYYKMLERVRNWNLAGYVYEDSATTEEQGDTLIKNGVTFSTCINSEISADAVETAREGATGYDIASVKITDEPLSTGSCTKFTWGIPVTSREPEAAAKFINEMYTNADIANLLAWGVEGRDYIVEDGVAKFPEGVDVSNVPYHTASFMYGNQFLLYPWDGDAADTYIKAEETLKNVPRSKYLGCTIDTAEVSNEITAVYNVIAEYKPAMESGFLDLEEYYPEFVERMEAAGVNRIVEVYQEQLDEWLVRQ